MGVGAHGAQGLLGPGAGDFDRGSGMCLCGRAVGRCVCGGLALGRTGGLWCGWGSGFTSVRALAVGRVWTRRVLFGVVEPGPRRGPGLSPFMGAWCRGVARAGLCGCSIRVAGHVCPPGRRCLVLPDCCGRVVLRLVSVCRPFGRTFLPGSLCGAGPQWCRSTRSSRWSAVGVVSGRSRWGWRWMGWKTWRSLGFVARAVPSLCRGVYTCSPGCGCCARPGLGGDGRDSPGGGGGAVVSGTPGRHPGHCRILLRARLQRWDEWLVGATHRWHESAGEGYPPPR